MNFKFFYQYPSNAAATGGGDTSGAGITGCIGVLLVVLLVIVLVPLVLAVVPLLLIFYCRCVL